MELIWRVQIKYNHDKFKIELNKTPVKTELATFMRRISMLYICVD